MSPKADPRLEDDRLKLLIIRTKRLDYSKSRAFEVAAEIENKFDQGAVLDHYNIDQRIIFLEIKLRRVKEAADDLKAVVPLSD